MQHLFTSATILLACVTIYYFETKSFYSYLSNDHPRVRAARDSSLYENLEERISSLHFDVDVLRGQFEGQIEASKGVITRNIIPIHIIEQTGGAFVSLISLGQIVYNLGYRLILPGVTDKATDETVFRGYASPAIQPYDFYFNPDTLQNDECLSWDFQYRTVETHHNLSPKIDVVLITVFKNIDWFQPDRDGLMVNGFCRERFHACQQDKEECSLFTWKLDVDLTYWDIPKDATVVCMTNTLDQYGNTFEGVLQSPHLGKHVENIAILNWMGVDCDEGSPRICSPIPSPEDQWQLRHGCFDTSIEMEEIAQSALTSSGISRLRDGKIHAVSYRTEFLSYLKGSKPCIEEYFAQLRHIARSWDGKWLRFVDYKEGASQTLADNLVGYEWLPEMLESFWDGLDATFIDFDCDGLDNVACSLRDAVLLAEADEIHFWGGGGGFQGNVNILRGQRGKDESLFFPFNPDECSFK